MAMTTTRSMPDKTPTPRTPQARPTPTPRTKHAPHPPLPAALTRSRAARVASRGGRREEVGLGCRAAMGDGGDGAIGHGGRRQVVRGRHRRGNVVPQHQCVDVSADSGRARGRGPAGAPLPPPGRAWASAETPAGELGPAPEQQGAAPRRHHATGTSAGGMQARNTPQTARIGLSRPWRSQSSREDVLEHGGVSEQLQHTPTTHPHATYQRRGPFYAAPGSSPPR